MFLGPPLILRVISGGVQFKMPNERICRWAFSVSEHVAVGPKMAGVAPETASGDETEGSQAERLRHGGHQLL